jgi:hypothetical protein
MVVQLKYWHTLNSRAIAGAVTIVARLSHLLRTQSRIGTRTWKIELHPRLTTQVSHTSYVPT